ncbi:transporter substrate-binding domain-containing protein [Enterovirga sp.]|jgi:polar amino acid transport system substrate-binding protein|uniref:transporter substrate-binding domain-containing protein n=1 Tax=Enterovirga sp. TaxID=2026350 RepID=UPI00260B0067|nr:transporter substrate-binding domain-containing protein [Enterovirga sp.]MDB5590245.1 extracellular solute-binding protein family 3 [Enterovirga sp.]
MTQRRRRTVLAPLRRGLQAVALLLVALGGVQAAHGQSALRIVTEGAYPPFNYVEGSDPAGFEVDLARALCDRMGLPCTITLQDWDGMYAGLKAGRYDAIMSSMEITPERRTRYRFSRRYYRVPSVLIGRKDGEPETQPFRPEDLAGRTVGAVANSEFEAYLEALRQPPSLRQFHKLEEAQLDLLTGRIDYVLGDKLALSRFLASREGSGCCREVADLPVDRGEGFGVALRKGDRGLAEMFDQAIEAVMADGTYDRIRAKYIPFDIK